MFALYLGIGKMSGQHLGIYRETTLPKEHIPPPKSKTQDERRVSD